MTVTYVTYLGIFVGIPTLLAGGVAVRNRHLETREDALGVGLLVAIALSYTFTWDKWLISMGVWHYGTDVVITRVRSVPLGELGFIVAQTLLTSFVLYTVVDDVETGRPGTVTPRAAGLLAIATVELLGFALTVHGQSYYLGHTLLWSLPIVGFLWFLGGDVLWRDRRELGLATLGPVLYLFAVDRLALHLGLWTISSKYVTGVGFVGLPVEEMTFFLVANVQVVFGLFLYRWLLATARATTLSRALRSLFPRPAGRRE